MITVLLGIIGFFTSSSDFIGSQLINAFSWMLIWFIFIGVIQFFMWFMMAIITAFGTKGLIGDIVFGKSFSLISGVLGASFISYIMLVKTALLLFLTYSLKNDINKNIELFSDLSQIEIFMIAIVIFLSLFSKEFTPIKIKLNK